VPTPRHTTDEDIPKILRIPTPRSSRIALAIDDDRTLHVSPRAPGPSLSIACDDAADTVIAGHPGALAQVAAAIVTAKLAGQLDT
jgi:hypothetical protein